MRYEVFPGLLSGLLFSGMLIQDCMLYIYVPMEERYFSASRNKKGRVSQVKEANCK